MRSMTLGEMKRLVDDLSEDYPAETPVRLAHQPNWAMQYEVSQIVAVDLTDVDEDEDGEPADVGQLLEPQTCIYIAEGSQPYDEPYLPGAAARELGWGRER